MENKLCADCGLVFDVDDSVQYVDQPALGVFEAYWGCPECGSDVLWDAPGGDE